MKKRSFLLTAAALVFAGCPEGTEGSKKYYEAPVPKIEITSTTYTVSCSEKITDEAAFIESVLRNQDYVKVSTAHGKHKGAFEFDADLSKLAVPHAHGKIEVPFIVKDSTGVFSKAVYPVYVTPVAAAPTVQKDDNVLTIPATESVTAEYLENALVSELNMKVTIGACATASTNAYTLTDWDISYVEGSETEASFTVVDALNSKSEPQTVRYLKEQNPMAPSITVPEAPIAVHCGMTTEEILTQLKADIEVSPGNTTGASLTAWEITSENAAQFTADVHFCMQIVPVTFTVRNNEGFESSATVNLQFDVRESESPFDPTSLISALRPQFIKGSAADGYSAEQMNALLSALLHSNAVLSEDTAGTCSDYLIQNNRFAVEITDGWESVDFNTAADYPLQCCLKAAVSEITVKDAFTATVKVIDPTAYINPNGDNIPLTVTVDGKTLNLTHLDPFDSQEVLETNWDIGNPGLYRPEIGNPGIEQPTLVEFPDGIKGYSGDRYKQPYWSPEAVEIKDGELLIKVYFDKSIVNKNLNNNKKEGYIPNTSTLDTNGYGVAGAIHSKRQFPSGLFVTKIKHSWGDRAGKTSAHWDAWWAESNNPFSRAYGKKELFSWGTDDSTRRGKVFTDGMPETQYKGVNGEQVYEYDMYEWVYDNNTQYQVLHSWPWYGGYPGWDDIPEEMRNQSRNYWITDDSWRGHDARGAGFGPNRNGTTEYNDGGQAKRGDWFYLAMLVTPEKVVMWNFPGEWSWDFNARAVSRSETGDMNPAFGNSAAPAAYRDADGKSPIQVKYSSELGQWNNNHNIIYNHRDQLTPTNPDIMHAEFFAFYAWDTDKYPSYNADSEG